VHYICHQVYRIGCGSCLSYKTPLPCINYVYQSISLLSESTITVKMLLLRGVTQISWPKSGMCYVNSLQCEQSTKQNNYVYISLTYALLHTIRNYNIDSKQLERSVIVVNVRFKLFVQLKLLCSCHNACRCAYISSIRIQYLSTLLEYCKCTIPATYLSYKPVCD